VADQINPDVDVPSEHQIGSFANAVRIIHDSGTEWFLDFLVFSSTENKAVVVSRVRVQEVFLGAIRDRLSTTLKKVQRQRQESIGPFPIAPVEGGGVSH
jgi:hypothetical protein